MDASEKGDPRSMKCACHRKMRHAVAAPRGKIPWNNRCPEWWNIPSIDSICNTNGAVQCRRALTALRSDHSMIEATTPAPAASAMFRTCALS